LPDEPEVRSGFSGVLGSLEVGVMRDEKASIGTGIT
jgi:hypothetical protein